jgi:peptide/nickel transport system substrate-binding protein
MKALGLGALLLAGGLSIQPAQAQKSADTLRVTWRDAVPNVIPYFNQQRSGFVLSHQVWDGLVYRDPDTFAIKPLLATSWKYVDDTTLEFKLRQGVKFQDGSPFTADDVVYTFNTVIHDKAVATPANYAWMASAKKIDDYTVQVKLKNIFPAAIEYLALVMPIMPKAYAEKVGLEAYAQHPIAAGPYKITKVDGTTEIDMERWEGYYADSPKGKPPIKKIKIHEVTDASTELNELLGRRADWIWKYNVDLLPKISAMPYLKAMQADSMRIIRLTPDAAGRSGKGNPLTKQKVRQAISYAIDRKTFAKQLIGGDSRVLDAYCYPTQFGCDASKATKYDYDPAKAKKLLAEAGYPNGFDTEIVSYVLPQWEGAIQNYLKAVGINAKITHLTVAATIKRILDGSAPMNLGSWGSYSVNDVSAILPNSFGGGGNDYARDPEVMKLLEQGGSNINPDERRKFYIDAIARITAEAYVLPLATQSVTYGMAKDLNFKPYPDELPRFYLSSWK